MVRLALLGSILVWAGVCCAQNQQFRAKIALDNGANLPAAPLFSPPAAGSELPPCQVVSAFANGVVIYIVPVILEPGGDPMRHLDDKCAITIWLRGYRKAIVTLYDGAVITLKQIGDPEGSTISVTALHVPKDAAKAYDKGMAALSDNKLPAAQKQFERAVAVYPEYAQAWSQLGEVLEQESKPEEAAQACRQALKADAKYIRPYLQLMRMAHAAKRAEECAELGERALKLAPVEFPGIYYFDALANYDLKHADIAERDARRAVELDTGHDYPESEVLLGKILAEKGDTRGAREHFENYLKLAPKAEDAPAIRQRLEELGRGAGE